LSRNKDRVGGTKDRNISDPAPLIENNGSGESAFSFVVPTDFVEIPSRGKYYPQGHPLHDEETVEIRHMTTKEEDILTSRSLLKRGIALDRVIQNLIVNKSIKADHLLVGDRNAIVIAARIAAYGADYDTKVTCPACNTAQEFSFNLIEAESHEGTDSELLEAVDNNNGTFEVKLPVTEVDVTFRLLTGVDEKRSIAMATNRKARRSQKDGGLENNISTQLASIIVAVNGDETPAAIKYLIENMPSMDSRHLRYAHRVATPNIDLTQTFECCECEFMQEMEVPLTADFFWPRR
jgi:hypothetical protein